jgi:hypothetical protein
MFFCSPEDILLTPPSLLQPGLVYLQSVLGLSGYEQLDGLPRSPSTVHAHIDFPVPVVRILEGDTMFSGIDCPEKEQPFGQKIKTRCLRLGLW